ncbi:dihydrodipicolinate synthase family protein [Microtetraspora sp. NBRC 13810]|uniref:dihydrodipicolinate synthase family protein n=1 Tax=Microtetraspora sp. NBRC 13810 TaxID=3030990 RepID=UPI0024A57DDA|nr:dihydrodipicolinate synthase family protein [Microtetraspora sp. NBRC 13810]GLW11715.1 dihydrodipicolinate synthase family protein [Microtetraspora sp. NBRC 13810]
MSDGRSLLRGVMVPLVTPMDRPGRPDRRAAPHLLSRMATAGVRGLLLLGSNGEGPLVPAGSIGGYVTAMAREWRELTPGGPVVVNVSAAGTLEALARAEAALPAGPDAFLLSPPSYFRHRDDEVVAHYAALAGLGVPVVVYNAPRYAQPLTPDLVARILSLDHVAGIKDSSGDAGLLAHIVAVARDVGGVGVTQGAERDLAAGLRAGADGIAPGLANFAPGPMAGLFAAHAAGDDAESDRLQAVATELTSLHAIRAGVPSVKELLRRRGLCTEHLAPPLLPCDEAERAAIHRFAADHSVHLVEGNPA